MFLKQMSCQEQYKIECNPLKTSDDIINRTCIERMLKFTWGLKRCQIAKADMSKKCNAGDIIILGYKLYCRTIVTKIKQRQPKIKSRPLNQQNATKCPKINPSSCSHMNWYQGKLDINKARSLIPIFTMYTNKLKMDHVP